MKEMIKTLVEAAKEKPLEFIGLVATMVAIFGFMYLGLWVAAILE